MTTNQAFITQVLRLTNQFRTQQGVAPLKLNDELSAAAQGHAKEMAQEDYFGHAGKDGSQAWDRAQAKGYSFSAIGENIAAGQKTPKAVVNAWKNSPGHRENLLNPTYKELGVGYFYQKNDTGSVNYNSYWAQVFGRGSSIARSAVARSHSTDQAGNAHKKDIVTGSVGHDVLQGNARDNLINGGRGEDWLTGKAGNDTLTGGAAPDLFQFNSDRPFQRKDFGIDRITDFTPGIDKIVLDQTTFGAITPNQIAIVSRDGAARKSDESIVYSRATGKLFFNSNGAAPGLGSGGCFAQIDNDRNRATAPPILSGTDFQIVA